MLRALFLRRVNLVKDLSAMLKGVPDPGEVTLKAGGVGGEGLVGQGLKSDITLGDKPAQGGEMRHTETEAAQFGLDLVQAAPEKKAKVLDQLKEGKGAAYTDALAAAIPQLDGPQRTRAREALAERLARMTAKTQRAKMKEDDPEVRRAAALACAMKDDKDYVPDLIAAIERPRGNGHAQQHGSEKPDQTRFRPAGRRDRGPAQPHHRRLERLVEETGEMMKSTLAVSRSAQNRKRPESPIVNPNDIEPLLLDKLHLYARPIADGRSSTGMRLQDPGTFFFTIEIFERLDRQRTEDTLLMVLDEFSGLEPSAYDELYLWSILHLSRSEPRHAATFWPLVLALDLRYRPEPWQRPTGTAIVDRPYRLTELLFYFYVLYTLHRRADGERRYPSLVSCLRRFVDELSNDAHDLVLDVLDELARTQKRPAFGDAFGLLRRAV